MGDKQGTSTSLSDAAAAFEHELARYAKIAAELGRTRVRSQKSLQRTQRLLTDAASCEEALGAQLQKLLEAMNGARDTQQACMEQTVQAAHHLQERATEFTSLLERVAALGARARETSEPAADALEQRGQGERGHILLSSLQGLGDRMHSIIEDAAQIVKDAEAGEWPDIARDVKSLKQQVEAAHGRIVQACAAVGSQVLS